LTIHKAENALAYSGTTDEKEVQASVIPIKAFLLLAIHSHSLPPKSIV
jgi:hypothetical protein